MKILLVEDNKKVASFVEKGLREEGYAVDVAFEKNDTQQQGLSHSHENDQRQSGKKTLGRRGDPGDISQYRGRHRSDRGSDRTSR